MKKTNNGLLCNINFYNEMLKAYAEGLTEFEYAGCVWTTDDIFMNFACDLKCGLLKVEAKVNI